MNFLYTESDKKTKDSDSSGSNTEVGDEENYDDEEEDEEEDEEDEDEEEEECEGSTTEIETDSEFAEDPPHSVPGRIPTIIVNEPEQFVTRLIDTNTALQNHHPKPEILEPVNLRNHPDRVMPRVTGIPKQWEPLPRRNPEALAAKRSLELKKKYLHGGGPVPGILAKTIIDPNAQKQFRSVLDMISEKQKLLQPGPKPSATMTAFLEGTDKLKQRNCSVSPNMDGDRMKMIEIEPKSLSPDTNEDQEKKIDTLECMNRLNLVKVLEASSEIGDLETKKIKNSSDLSLSPINGSSEEPMNLSSTPSLSQSESQSTIIATTAFEDAVKIGDDRSSSNDIDDEDSGTDGQLSDFDQCCDDDEDFDLVVKREPPRVEIEDEFGITLSLDLPQELNNKNYVVNNNNYNDRTPVDNEFCKVGMSSSDSKDSLNSGVFLETELSDWTRDVGEEKEGGAIPVHPCPRNGGKGKKKTVVRKKVMERNAKREQLAREGKDLRSLELDGLDFMDVDAVSSPEDQIRNITRKQGYCKLASEDEEAEEPNNVIPKCPIEDREAVLEKSSTSSPSTSTTPTIDSVSRANVDILEAINPVLVSKEPKIPVLDRVVPFSKARDSLDYRKGIKGITASKGPYSEFMVRASSTEESSLVSKPLPLTVEEEKSNLLVSSTSPITARKIEAIQKEKAKQSEWIRSMVLGRMSRQSPEKNGRRSARGSESPLGGSSSKGSKEEVESSVSRRSSQNSILSSSQDGDEPVCVSSSPVSESNSNKVVSPCSIEPEIMAESDTTSASDNNKNVHSAHSTKPLLSSPVNEMVSPTQYEPVFTSSPRFRNRPKFESPFEITSTTAPTTPVSGVNKTVALFATDRKKKTTKGKKSPAFYQSMPDLSVFGVHDDDSDEDCTPEMGPTDGEFTTPSVQRWELFKSVEREKARREARERARLKSDEELGLSPTDYASLKEKVRRRGSVPDSDSVFLSPSPRGAASVPSTPTRGIMNSARKPFDPFMSHRPNLDFPEAKADPFLIPEPIKRGDNRKASPEKAKSMGSEILAEAVSPYSVDSNWVLSKSRDNTFRPRSNTMSDLKHYSNYPGNLTPKNVPVPVSQGISKAMHVHSCTNVVAPAHNVYNSNNNGNHHQHGAMVFSGNQQMIGTNSSGNNASKVLKALSSDTLLEDFSACPRGGNSPLEPLMSTLSGGRSVPDIVSTARLNNDNQCPLTSIEGHKGGKKGKDRDRRRSLIHTGIANVARATFSGLFNRNSNNNTSGTDSGNGTPEKIGNSSVTGSPSKEKFSFFKLTPKLLNKDRRKSKETLMTSPVDCKSGVDPITIQSLKSSPNPGVGRRASFDEGGNGAPDDMATLSFIASTKDSVDDPVVAAKMKKGEREKARNAR